MSRLLSLSRTSEGEEEEEAEEAAFTKCASAITELVCAKDRQRASRRTSGERAKVDNTSD